MKKVFRLVIVLVTLSFGSCTTVDSGHAGVEVSWGGETNMNAVYNEGMSTGLHWIWDDMVEYDVREKTLVERFEFNDKDNMVTKVELALDYRLDRTKVNFIHKEISDIEIKILKTLKSAGKEVVPQYSAIEFNITKRNEAEAKFTDVVFLSYEQSKHKNIGELLNIEFWTTIVVYKGNEEKSRLIGVAKKKDIFKAIQKGI